MANIIYFFLNECKTIPYVPKTTSMLIVRGQTHKHFFLVREGQLFICFKRNFQGTSLDAVLVFLLL